MSFDRVAPYYDALARLVFGKSIRRAQCHFLSEIPPEARVLVVGGGTGWLLPHLLRQPEVAHITYLETSSAMLTRAQQKINQFGKQPVASVNFIHGDEYCLTTETFSVIITNFVLDMYEGTALDEFVRTLAGHLACGGIWLFTDFRFSTQKRHRWWQYLMANTMYLFFHLTTGIARQKLPPYHQHFIKQGFQTTREQAFFYDFIISRVYGQSRPTG